MTRVEDIFRAYRNGGIQERMDAYLAYPGLRSRFDEIEREEERGSRPGKAAEGKYRLWRLCRLFPSGRPVGHS